MFPKFGLFFLVFCFRPVVPLTFGRTFLEEAHDLIGRRHTGVVVGLRGLGAHLLLGEDQPLAEPSAQRWNNVKAAMARGEQEIQGVGEWFGDFFELGFFVGIQDLLELRDKETIWFGFWYPKMRRLAPIHGNSNRENNCSPWELGQVVPFWMLQRYRGFEMLNHSIIHDV